MEVVRARKGGKIFSGRKKTKKKRICNIGGGGEKFRGKKKHASSSDRMVASLHRGEFLIKRKIGKSPYHHPSNLPMRSPDRGKLLLRNLRGRDQQGFAISVGKFVVWNGFHLPTERWGGGGGFKKLEVIWRACCGPPGKHSLGTGWFGNANQVPARGLPRDRGCGLLNKKSLKANKITSFFGKLQRRRVPQVKGTCKERHIGAPSISERGPPRARGKGSL